MSDDIPMYVSEYRDTYGVTEEFEDDCDEEADINIFAISVCRLHAIKAKELLAKRGIRANVIHIMWLKPFHAIQYTHIIEKIPYGVVVEPGREICGAAEHIAYELMTKNPGSNIARIGLEDVAKTTNPNYYNEVPQSDKIVKKVLDVLGR